MNTFRDRKFHWWYFNFANRKVFFQRNSISHFLFSDGNFHQNMQLVKLSSTEFYLLVTNFPSLIPMFSCSVRATPTVFISKATMTLTSICYILVALLFIWIDGPIADSSTCFIVACHDGSYNQRNQNPCTNEHHLLIGSNLKFHQAKFNHKLQKLWIHLWTQ